MRSRLLKGDNPHMTFMAHDCIPTKPKIELLTARKKFNVETSAILKGRIHYQFFLYKFTVQEKTVI